jgi:hypothetical protein
MCNLFHCHRLVQRTHKEHKNYYWRHVIVHIRAAQFLTVFLPSASYICSILEAYSSSVAVQWNEQNHHHCLSVGDFLSLSHNITGCLNPLLSRFFLTGCPTFLESKKHEASNLWRISSSNHVHKNNNCYNLSYEVPVCPIHLSQFWVSLWAEKQTNSWKIEPDKFWHKYITLRLDPPFIILTTLRFGQARLDCQS